MYAVSKEHKGTKILAKTRRAAIPQKFDNIDANPRDNNNGIRKDLNGLQNNQCFGGSSNPRPVFHMNGRKTYQQRNQSESITVQHQEMVKYIHENWKCVKKDLDSTNRHSFSGEYKNPNIKVPQICYYKIEKTSIIPSIVLQIIVSNICLMICLFVFLSNPEFEPFDLESFWGQRLFQNITQLT